MPGSMASTEELTTMEQPPTLTSKGQARNGQKRRVQQTPSSARADIPEECGPPAVEDTGTDDNAEEVPAEADPAPVVKKSKAKKEPKPKATAGHQPASAQPVKSPSGPPEDAAAPGSPSLQPDLTSKSSSAGRPASKTPEGQSRPSSKTPEGLEKRKSEKSPPRQGSRAQSSRRLSVVKGGESPKSGADEGSGTPPGKRLERPQPCEAEDPHAKPVQSSPQPVSKGSKRPRKEKVRNDLHKLTDNSAEVHEELKNILAAVQDSRKEKHAQNVAALDQGVSFRDSADGGSWTETTDPESGRPYWFHTRTRESRWEKPLSDNTPEQAASFGSDLYNREDAASSSAEARGRKRESEETTELSEKPSKIPRSAFPDIPCLESGGGQPSSSDSCGDQVQPVRHYTQQQINKYKEKVERLVRDFNLDEIATDVLLKSSEYIILDVRRLRKILPRVSKPSNWILATFGGTRLARIHGRSTAELQTDEYGSDRREDVPEEAREEFASASGQLALPDVAAEDRAGQDRAAEASKAEENAEAVRDVKSHPKEESPTAQPKASGRSKRSAKVLAKMAPKAAGLAIVSAAPKSGAKAKAKAKAALPKAPRSKAAAKSSPEARAAPSGPVAVDVEAAPKAAPSKAAAAKSAAASSVLEEVMQAVDAEAAAEVKQRRHSKKSRDGCSSAGDVVVVPDCHSDEEVEQVVTQACKTKAKGTSSSGGTAMAKGASSSAGTAMANVDEDSGSD